MKNLRSARCRWYGHGTFVLMAGRPDPSRQRGRGQVGVVAWHSPLILCPRRRRSSQEDRRD
jgi:hypothetical protein